jgi:hypothetical protein
MHAVPLRHRFAMPPLPQAGEDCLTVPLPLAGEVDRASRETERDRA